MGQREVYQQISGFLLLLVLTAGPLQAAGLVNAFQEGVKNYQQGNYQAAIADFSKVADGAVKSSQLFYNLGNSYLKNGDLGHAVLWYKRALKLSPHDPDLQFNYTYALSRLEDLAPVRQDSVFRIFFFWNLFLSPAAVQWMAIVLNGIFWIILIGQQLFRSKAGNFLRHPVLILAAIATLTAGYNYYEDNYRKRAIILPAEISVRSGLSDTSTVLFVLHAGSLVQVEEGRGDFLKIRFSKDKIGWLRKRGAELI